MTIIPKCKKIMMNALLKSMIERMGYTITNKDAKSDNKIDAPVSPNIWNWLKKFNGISTLIDIGANDGQFGRFLSNFFSPQESFAFEPIPDCIPQINALGIPNLTVYNIALSDCEGQQKFYLNKYSPASSLLHVSSISKNEFPETSEEEPILVDVKCLDDVLDANQLKKDIFIKIDVQGFEDKVIKGGRKVFAAAKFILIEMSFVPFYDGQPLFEEVHDQLRSLGFRFSGIKNQVCSPKTGQPLFCHCLYSRE